MLACKNLIRCLVLLLPLSYGVAVAVPQQDHPFQSKATSSVNLSNWQKTRGYGLRNFEKISPNLIAVNSEHIRKLTVTSNYGIDQLPAVRSLILHRSLDAIVILKENKIEYEH
ncbi:MAG: hypothetical protein GY821_09820 [Gammaproteobacteria bacterium]|nr:hypothetical protein [Gammaproteobacteria bacterium]